MRLLVCGSRDWSDQKLVNIVLLGFMGSYESLEIIEGEAPGADSCARTFGEFHNLIVHKFPADWAKNGRSAGPIRNQQMLDEASPAAVVAFKDGFNARKGKGGTEDMVRRSRDIGLPTIVISHGDNI